MKQILLLAFIFLISLNIQAQLSIEVEPENLQYSLQADMNDEWAETLTYAHATVTNTSNQTIKLRWERLADTDCPSEWQYRICDNIACYSTNTSSNVMANGSVNEPVYLEPGQSTNMDVHVIPHLVMGCCTLKLRLTDITDPNNEIEITVLEYEICVSPATSVTVREKAALKVFPNPTADYISLSQNNFVKEVWVSNILGKRVKSFNTTFSGRYDISNLPDGMYLVSMVGENRKVLKTVRVSKRGIRP